MRQSHESAVSKTARSTTTRRVAGILSFGLLALGVGCVGWALVRIEAQAASFEPYVTPIARQATQTADAQEPTVTVNVAVRAPRRGERIGTLSIPSLKLRLPIVEGTDDDALDKGVGHFSQSVMPGQQDNCVLAGHRDTVFARLGTLKLGEDLVVQTGAGMFTYQITKIRIVHKDDKTVIVPSDHAILTVSTCYPFHYVGFAPDRYILVADLIASE
jgi:sortase A